MDIPKFRNEEGYVVSRYGARMPQVKAYPVKTKKAPGHSMSQHIAAFSFVLRIPP